MGPGNRPDPIYIHIIYAYMYARFLVNLFDVGYQLFVFSYPGKFSPFCDFKHRGKDLRILAEILAFEESMALYSDFCLGFLVDFVLPS